MAADNTDVEREGPNSIQAYHDEAYLYISQGLSYEEREENELACDMYNKGIEKINMCLNIRCDRPYCVGSNWDKARTLQQKMRKNLPSIKKQLEKLSLVYQNEIRLTENGLSESPPTYDEACEQSGFSFARRASCPITSSDITDDAAVGNILSGTNAKEIFQIPSGVQLFFVSSDGSVTTPASPSSLSVYSLNTTSTLHQNAVLPSAWLQVGSWTYPLVQGQSPVLETGYGAFIFPDVMNDEENSSVGVILPADVDFETRRKFENILANLTKIGIDEEFNTSNGRIISVTETSSGSFGDSISRGIIIGAEYLQVGLVKGASLTSEYIHKGAAKLKEHLRPDEKAATFDPKLKEGLKVAKSATTTAYQVSSFLVNKLGELTVALGNRVAPIIREHGTKFLAHTFKNDPEKAKNTVDGFVKVAAGGVQGFSAIYMGLEHAAVILAYSLSTETVNVVGHKYGSEAEEVVGNALFSVGNLALATHNVNSLGVKSVAKRTAKDAGKAVLRDYADQLDKPIPRV